MASAARWSTSPSASTTSTGWSWSCSSRSAPHANKQRLHEWYCRLGYRQWGRRDFTVVDPEQGELLAAPADLVGYRKTLR